MAIREYGVDVGNGIIEVWATDEENHWLVRRETYSENQGVALPNAPTLEEAWALALSGGDAKTAQVMKTSLNTALGFGIQPGFDWLNLQAQLLNMGADLQTRRLIAQAQITGYVPPELTVGGGGQINRDAVNELRARLRALGGEFAALAELDDEALVRHIENDPTLFVGDPIRARLRIGGAGPVPTLERERFEEEQRQARFREAMAARAELQRLAASPGDYSIYLRALRGDFGPLPGGGPLIPLGGGLQRVVPLPEGTVPPGYSPYLEPGGGPIWAMTPGQTAVERIQAGQPLTIGGGPTGVAGITPAGIQAQFRMTPTEREVRYGVLAQTGVPLTDIQTYEQELLRRSGLGVFQPAF